MGDASNAEREDILLGSADTLENEAETVQVDQEAAQEDTDVVTTTTTNEGNSIFFLF